MNFRMKPNTNAPLIDRIPCGETVDVLSEDGEWSQVRWNGHTGYMMSKFLIHEGADDPTEELFCVTIHDLPKSVAEGIVSMYGGSIRREVG